MRPRILHHLLIIATIIAIYASSASGQVYVANGDAVALGGDCFRLTTQLTNQAGSVWFQNKISLASDFEVQATINLGTIDAQGADGMAFVLQPICTGLGSSGGGIGYAGITPSLAIEFDTWQNNEYGDPFADHISLQQNGVLQHASAFNLAGPFTMSNLEDGLDHDVIVHWDAGTQTLTLTFDSNLIFTFTQDIVATIFGNNPEVFWGFTAATGAAFNNQSVCIDSVAFEELIPYSVIDASCPNASDGAIDLTISGGVGPFTFLWNTGAMTEDLAGVAPGTYIVEVTDANGCTSTYTIEVGSQPDTTLPTAICQNASVVLDATGNASITTTDIDNGSMDECELGTLSLDKTDFTCADIGTNTVTLTVTDAATNVSTCQATVEVSDITPPTVLCQDASFALDATGNLSITTAGIDNGSMDACGLDSMWLDKTDFTCDDIGANILTLTATDASGNTTTCQATVEISDTTTPTAVCKDVSLTLDATGNVSITTADIDNGSMDECQLGALSLDNTDFTCDDIGTNTVTLTVTDAAGNTASCEATVEIQDLTPPELTCPAEIAITCDAVREPSNTGMATALDVCSAFDVSYTDVTTTLSCEDELLIERTWVAKDIWGNATSCLQTIKVMKDAILPECLNCPGDITVACDNIPPVPNNLVLSDNCDPAPSFGLGALTTQTSDGTCTDYSYFLTRIFTITDRCGNSQDYTQVITVLDDQAPSIVCPADTTVSCTAMDDISVSGMPVISDNCDPAPGMSYTDAVVSGNCDLGCTIERTWKAADACANESNCVQTITSTTSFEFEEALNMDIDGDGLPDPLVLGRHFHTLTITAEAAPCISGWLPGASAPPSALPRKQSVVDPLDCKPGRVPVNSDGQILNPLLTETLLLGLKLRLNPDIGNTLLSETGCYFHPVLFQYMPNNPTIDDFYELANLGLGNIIGPPHLQHIVIALHCLNGLYELCNVAGGGMLAMAPQLVEPSLHPAMGKLSEETILNLFPNPAYTALNFELPAVAGQLATVRIFNAQGKMRQQIPRLAISEGANHLDIADFADGIYWLQIEIEGKEPVIGKFVVMH